MINDFEFVQAHDIPAALQALAGEGRIIPVAGGTNVLVNMKRAPLPADLVLDLTRVEALAPITTGRDHVRFGANVTFAQLLEWSPGGPLQELVRPMCMGFAGPLIRNLATVGGNVCDASPAADVSPVLLALDAQVELESAAEGSRVLALTDFFQGVRRTARRRDELLTGISCDRPREDERVFYYKLGKRRADAISIVSVAIRLRLEAGKVEMARIALGAVAPVAMRATDAETVLLDGALSDQTIAEAASVAAREAQPIDDFRSGGAYRRQMVETLVARGLRQIAAHRQGAPSA
ncbi:MAG: FAD binding domain-containing protein [Xanthomonadales bacterium]|nr:FAD binding domain-containing protein [Xanthomonadales bacterium]